MLYELEFTKIEFTLSGWSQKFVTHRIFVTQKLQLQEIYD